MTVKVGDQKCLRNGELAIILSCAPCRNAPGGAAVRRTSMHVIVMAGSLLIGMSALRPELTTVERVLVIGLAYLLVSFWWYQR